MLKADSAPCANILVVDDDAQTLTAMAALLCGEDRNVVTASSGAEALRWILRRDSPSSCSTRACPR